MPKPRKLRRAGAFWRLLVHQHPTDAGQSDRAFHVRSDNVGAAVESEWSETRVLPRTEFDELVVGPTAMIHIEQMDNGVWWLNIAGVTLWLHANRDGKPTLVNYYGPGAYAEPVDGVEYVYTPGSEKDGDDGR